MPALVATLVLALGLVAGIQEGFPQRSLTEGISFKFNEGYPSFTAESLRFLSFGYSRALSSLLWVRFLEDNSPRRLSDDEVSWIYLDLDATTTIDPDFLPAFEYGGLFLSVVTNDKKGAELLLKKGTLLHPDSWPLHSLLAYHYQFELEDPEKALAEYEAAAKIPGAPELMGILAARLMAKENSVDASIAFLEQLLANAKTDVERYRLQNRLDLWKAKKRKEGKP